MRMKKFYLLTLLTLLLVRGMAQNVGGGAVAGLVLSQIDGDGFGGYDKIGWQVGGFAWYDLNEIWAIQPELLVTNRGSRDGVNYRRLSTTYIDVPVMVNFHVIPSRGDRLIAQAGPSFSYLLDAQVGLAPYKSDNSENYKKYDLALNGGLVYKINETLSLSGRFTKSFMSIRSGSNLYTSGFTTHRYLTFGLRIQFKK
jgi:hypothetical protein